MKNVSGCGQPVDEIWSLRDNATMTARITSKSLFDLFSHYLCS